MKKQRKKRNNRKKFWLLLILFLAFIFRFYKLSEFLNWLLDEEFWAYIPFNIATGYHFPLIGGHISSTGLYSGPLFVWLMAIPFWLVKGNPLGIAAFVSLVGVITTALTFFVGKTLFSEKVGLLAALLSATSFLMAIYDRKYWNASPIPLLSLLAILSLYKISEGKLKWAYVLAVVLALAFHAHMTSGALFLMIIFSWLSLKLPVKRKQVVGAIVLFFALQLPLLAFELRHNFLNSKALINFFNQSSRSQPIIQSFLEVGKLAANTAGRLIYMPAKLDLTRELTLCSQYANSRAIPPVWAMILAVLAVIFVCKNRKKTSNKLLLMLLLANFTGVLFYRIKAGDSWYPGQLSEYFFFPSFPIIFIMLASFLAWLMKKKPIKLVSFFVSAIIVLTNISALLLASHSDNYSRKLKVVKQAIAKVGDKPFSLIVVSDDPCLQYGYRYLFTYLKKEPDQSYLDPQFNWLYEGRLTKKKPEKNIKINLSSATIDLQVEDVSEN